ncbi:MAG: putative neutral zinc metallopeptidase [Gemmatimonadetes bacterium]|nr:putative neutral zinc metallopeptidase [Gemmatimonadota bacterium]
MRWQGGRSSSNVEDKRGMRLGPGLAAGGGLGAVVIALISMLLGADPREVLNGGGPATQQQQQPNAPPAPGQDTAYDFVSKILGSTEDVWGAEFQRQGMTYQQPKLDLFTNPVQSGCGTASAEVGPFYCPRDHKVYLDLAFFRDLRERFQAPGEFAEAYVIAHEVGHHVQSQLGITQKVEEAVSRGDPREGAEGLSVRTELQADCFAGIWASKSEQRQHWLDTGDVESALAAATAIGDDRLQREARGTVVPESFTHGTSAQRVRWFRRGMESGDLRRCDTFQASSL